ncbi:MAG TPA: sigma 54-interacting transcriptional regulator [Polyangiaceae bacterium]
MVGDDDRDLEATIQSGQSGQSGQSRQPGQVGAGGIGVSVVVLSGAQRGATVPLRGKVRVGKAPDNDLVLPGDTVSRQHCELSRVAGGVRIRDLGSTNGTFVESARITDAVTPVGTVFRVGDSVELALRPDLEVLDVEPYPDPELEGVIGPSVAMRRIFRVLDGIAKTDATVLLQGETGTGKEVLARAVARRSLRPEPFVVVDCGAVTPTLIQSELFGHERGAFTGAVAQRRGAFESADGGTIFLDEIGELPLDVQPMLLRILEAREFRRVGGNQTLHVDVRVIAATSRDLEREVSGGKFREDLYFRLAVVPVRIPPLRARREDIPALVQHILARTKGAGALAPSGRTMEWLLQHDWPGNVRELRNLLERAAYMSVAAGSREILLPALPPAGSADPGEELFRFSLSESYREARARVEDEFERRYVAWLLAKHHGNLSAAARAVQMDRKHLHVLARKHGLRGESDEGS